MNKEISTKTQYYFNESARLTEELNDVITYNEVLEHLIEGVTRKHFQQTAEAIAEHPDAKKRTELANHHAAIFIKQNPRFDKGRFVSAIDAHVKHLASKSTSQLK